MKKINVHNVTKSLSSKEMKAVTGGSQEASGCCCEPPPYANCDYSVRCTTNEQCENMWGKGATCSK